MPEHRFSVNFRQGFTGKTGGAVTRRYDADAIGKRVHHNDIILAGSSE
jgi:hypothetical protein